MRFVNVLAILSCSLSISCGHGNWGGRVTEDGWPVRKHEQQVRCPDGTFLVDEVQPSGARIVSCRLITNPMPQGFVLQWSPEGRLVQELRITAQGLPDTQKSWYENGTKRSDEVYEQGMLRTRKVWYTTGEIQEESTQTPDGFQQTLYQPDGQIEAKGTYVGDLRVGEWVLWRDGATETVVYVNGLEEGAASRRYLDGSVESGQYVAGQKEKTWLRQSSNGVPILRVTWKAGIRNGSFEQFHPNGQMATEGVYLTGRKEGLWNSWFSNGQKKSQGTFVCDRETGEWRTWHTNGILASRGVFEAGQRVGEWQNFTASGELERVESFPSQAPSKPCE